jgi:predicted site-specific integrase-resolvase
MRRRNILFRLAIKGDVMASDKLTPVQAGAALGVSPQTLANWRWQGIGPAYIKLSPGRGGRVRYTRAAIEQWLTAQTVQPNAAA